MEELLRTLGIVINAAAEDDGGAPKGDDPPKGDDDDDGKKAAAKGDDDPPKGGDDDDDDDDDDPPKPHWAERRLNKEVARNSELRGRIGELERELTALKGKNDEKPKGEEPATSKGRSEAEIQAEIDAKAEELANRKAAEKAFQTRTEDTYNKGQEAYGDDWRPTVSNFTKIGGLGALEEQHGFMSAVLDTDNPPKVLYELGKDLGRAAEIVDLTPNRMILELNKIAVSKPKKQSAAPKPPDPVGSGGGRTEPEGLSDELDTTEWMRRRNEEAKKSGRRRLGG